MSIKIQTAIGIIIGVIILWLVSVAVRGQEIQDLGRITNHRGIVLERCTNRTDFLRFEIEMDVPRGTNGGTTLIRTNDFLTLDDFGMLPEGPAVIGVRSICQDGEGSPLALFRVEIRRNGPTKPGARVITMGSRTNHATLQETLQTRKAARTNSMGSAPMPGSVSSGSGKSSSDLPPMGTPSGGPMRGGSNESYSEHMAKMAEYFKQKTRK